MILLLLYAQLQVPECLKVRVLVLAFNKTSHFNVGLVELNRYDTKKAQTVENGHAGCNINAKTYTYRHTMLFRYSFQLYLL